jgi:hypothetical protein
LNTQSTQIFKTQIFNAQIFETTILNASSRRPRVLPSEARDLARIATDPEHPAQPDFEMRRRRRVRYCRNPRHTPQLHKYYSTQAVNAAIFTFGDGDLLSHSQATSLESHGNEHRFGNERRDATQ